MQNRMKTHPLSQKQIEQLLNKAATGTLATISVDGTPYATPVHFVFFQNKVYLHGLPKGKKMSNIAINQKVSFTAYEMEGLLLDPKERPCDTNTRYQSIIISGTASILSDIEGKRAVLHQFVMKYTPHLEKAEIPQNMLKGTAIIEISIDQITGKYY